MVRTKPPLGLAMLKAISNKMVILAGAGFN
jgi:hypothetical protein